MVIHPITGILRKWLQNKPMNIWYPIPWCFTDKSNLWPRWSKWSVQHNEHLLFFNLNLIHLGSHSHWHSTCHDHALDKAAHLKQIGSSSTEIQWWLGNGHAMVKRLLQTASTIKYCNLGILLVPSCTVWYCVYIYNLKWVRNAKSCKFCGNQVMEVHPLGWKKATSSCPKWSITTHHYP